MLELHRVPRRRRICRLESRPEIHCVVTEGERGAAKKLAVHDTGSRHVEARACRPGAAHRM